MDLKLKGDEAALGESERFLAAGLVHCQVRVPASFTLREEEDVIERGVGRIQVVDDPEPTIAQVEDNVLRVAWVLPIRVAYYDHHLVRCW